MNRNEKASRSILVEREAPLLEKNPPVNARYVAVIARDSLQEATAQFRRSKRGFWPLFPKIACEASRHGADVLMFSLWSHDERRMGELSKKDLFPIGTHHSAVLLGVKRHDGKELVEHIEVWHRSRRSPLRLRQYFARVSDSKKRKELLIQNLTRRQFGPTMLLLCGETNIVRTQRGKADIVDDFRFRSRLRKCGIDVIFNPSHTYMHRPEMARKRRAISRWVRIVISVWNRGNPEKGSESKLPWVAYSNGKDITGEIKEITLPAELRQGVRMGLIRVG